MDNNIVIRLATANDFEAIYAIWLEGIESSFDVEQFSKEVLRQKFKMNFDQRKGIFNYWVAIDAVQQVVGWQSLIRFSNNPFRQNTYAESSTYITRQTRAKGIGKLLLEYVIREAEESELDYVIGFVSTANEAAKRITEETGWIEVGVMPQSTARKSKIQKSFLVRPV